MSLLPNSIEGRSQPYLARVENVLADLDRMKGEYMAACKAKREDIKEIYKEAKDDDIPVRALKGLVKYRELERRQAELAETIPDEEVSEFEMLVEALGDYADTPLGQAALDLAGDGDDGDDPRPRFKKTEDQPPAPKKRKPKSPTVEPAQAQSGESDEEREALAEVESKGIAGAVSGAVAH